MVFVDTAAGLQVSDITGNLIIEKNGQKQNMALTKELLAEWMPVIAIKRIPRQKLVGREFVPVKPLAAGQKLEMGNWCLRKIGYATVWAKQGEEVSLTLKGGQIGKYAMNPIPVVVTGPDGTEVTKASVPMVEGGTVTFAASATGLHTIKTDAGGNYAVYTASSHPLNFTGAGEAVHFISSTGTVYFYVPQGTKEFGLRIFGEGIGEGVKATLMNAAGEVVEMKDNVAGTNQFTIELPQPSPGEAWSVKIEKPSAMTMEDFYLDPLGLPPLVAPSAESLLKPVQ
jgi:hypothetical protein